MPTRAGSITLLAVILAGCGGGLSDADVTDLQNAERATARIYAREHAATDGGSFTAALARGAYCATAVVLARADASVPPLDGVQCEAPK
jgi:outer membrane PBP1 activator LpoA protein